MTDLVRTQFTDGHQRPYSASAAACGIIFLCGQVPTRPNGTCSEQISEQVEQTIDNIESALHAAGSDLSQLLKLTVYLADLGEFDDYNRAYLDRLSGHPLPPRTTVQVAAFRGRKRIEIDAFAALSA